MTVSLSSALLRSTALLGLTLVLLLATPSRGAWADGTLPASASDAIAADVFDRLNDERAARGLPPLRWDAQLAGLATGSSVQMSRTDDYVHSDLDQVIQDPAYGERWSGLGENIQHIPPGHSTAGRAHAGWMRSDGHRMNILNAGYDAVGIGIVCDGDGRMWASQTFGRMQGSQGPGYDHTAPPADPIHHADTGGSSCEDHLHARHGADWPGGAALTASDVRADAVTLDWAPATREVAGYRLEMDAGRGFEAIATTGPQVRRHTQVDLSPDTRHRFRVQVLDARGHSHAGPQLTLRSEVRSPRTAGLPAWSSVMGAARESASRLLALAVPLITTGGVGVLRSR